MPPLSTVSVGRIAYTDRALPAIRPVNFALQDGRLFIRVEPGDGLAAAVSDTVVAFEADDIGPRRHTGWSVQALGRAHLTDDPLAVLGPAPDTQSRVPSIRGHFIVIRIEHVTGRRVPPPADPR
ncbi:pyridoxamine 5'-phosphate oxidase family protein [Streptomyces sp. S.PB5]|uniref:pyridoxamine 5'-phosphate oxidase family protein n=1 Tax=Streptomyces sp. S.PB5 TaxID=3020844 RepID=UPI0025B23A94|nr:pyridoxamine 5'-phosphate oxidase family protein [Streptomyces sp. S.PB5]MDN3029004.1 pyridoxamine 5'-phosphate oxidase family protein [Streptomyces sp. S.PB5]